jgi:hypothetical protein
MDRRLRDEAVGHGKPDDACDEGRAAEEEEVPVEAGGLFEWKLAGLGGQTADVLDEFSDVFQCSQAGYRMRRNEVTNT